MLLRHVNPQFTLKYKFSEKNSVETTRKNSIFCFLAAEENYIAAKFCRNNLYANFVF